MKDMLKTSVAAAALMAFAVPASAQSNIETGQPKVKLKVYGQVNKALMYADDGNNFSRLSIVDWDVSSTRFGVVASAPVTANVTFGGQIELEYQSNASNNINNLNGDGDFNQGQTTWLERVGQITIAHKQFGKVTLGQGPTASDGSAESDLSGTVQVLGSLAASSGPGFLFIQKNSPAGGVGTTTGGVIVTTTHANLDGMSRADRIRYDTPVFGGFSLATSFVSGGQGDVGAQYSGKLAGFQILARAAYFNQNSATTLQDDGYAGSISVLHDSGISGTLAGGKQRYKTSAARESGDYINGKLGYTAKIFASGPTSFGVEYGTYDNLGANNSEGDTWAVGAEHSFKDIGATAYIAYRNFSWERSNTEYEDIKMFVTGMVVRF